MNQDFPVSKGENQTNKNLCQIFMRKSLFILSSII